MSQGVMRMKSSPENARKLAILPKKTGISEYDERQRPVMTWYRAGDAGI
jgi:hypothetical protein